MVLILVAVSKIIILPAKLAQSVGNGAWLSLVLLLAVDAILFTLFYLAFKKNPEQTLYKSLSGKSPVLGKIIYGILAVFFILRAFYAVYGAGGFVFTNLYDTVSWMPFALLILLGGAFAAYKGLRAASRMTELLGGALLLVIVAGLIFAAWGADLFNILPLLESGLPPVFGAAGDYIFLSLDLLILFLFLGKTVPGKKTSIAAITGFSAGAALSLMYGFLFIAYYGRLAAYMQLHAPADMTQMFIAGEGVERFDIVINIAWTALAVIKCFFLIWAAAESVKAVFFGEEKTPKAKLLSAGIVTVIILALLVFLSDRIFLDGIISGIFKYVALGVALIIALIALILPAKNSSFGSVVTK